MAFLRTALLLGMLTGILVSAGFLLGGYSGMIMALVLASFMNLATYWWSDKIVLRMYKAQPSKDRKLNSIVRKLAKQAGIPEPRTYIIPTEVPNAFATGRSPKHAAVAATAGLLKMLNHDEIEGVLAHELAHVKNRDILISAMAATIGGAVSFLAHMAWWSMIGNRRDGMVLLPLVVLAPIAAMLVQLAISRGREYHADYTGAMTTRKPLALVSALQKISNVAKRHPLRGNPATAHMWIVNPFAGGMARLFSTHPSLESRVERLRAIKI